MKKLKLNGELFWSWRRILRSFCCNQEDRVARMLIKEVNAYYEREEKWDKARGKKIIEEVDHVCKMVKNKKVNYKPFGELDGHDL